MSRLAHSLLAPRLALLARRRATSSRRTSSSSPSQPPPAVLRSIAGLFAPSPAGDGRSRATVAGNPNIPVGASRAAGKGLPGRGAHEGVDARQATPPSAPTRAHQPSEAAQASSAPSSGRYPRLATPIFGPSAGTGAAAGLAAGGSRSPSTEPHAGPAPSAYPSSGAPDLTLEAWADSVVAGFRSMTADVNLSSGLAAPPLASPSAAGPPALAPSPAPSSVKAALDSIPQHSFTTAAFELGSGAGPLAAAVDALNPRFDGALDRAALVRALGPDRVDDRPPKPARALPRVVVKPVARAPAPTSTLPAAAAAVGARKESIGLREDGLRALQTVTSRGRPAAQAAKAGSGPLADRRKPATVPAGARLPLSKALTSAGRPRTTLDKASSALSFGEKTAGDGAALPTQGEREAALKLRREQLQEEIQQRWAARAAALAISRLPRASSLGLPQVLVFPSTSRSQR